MLRIKNRVLHKACDRLTDYLFYNFTPIEVLGGEGRFNHRCHENAVQYYTDNSEDSLEVCEVIAIDPFGFPCLHYIIYHTEDKFYLDPTLGWQADKNYCYYLIRTIHENDHHKILSIFNASHNYWTKRFTNWLQRLILGDTNIL